MAMIDIQHDTDCLTKGDCVFMLQGTSIRVVFIFGIFKITHSNPG